MAPKTPKDKDVYAVQILESLLLHIRKMKVYFVPHQKDGWICHLITYYDQEVQVHVSIGSEVPISC